MTTRSCGISRSCVGGMAGPGLSAPRLGLSASAGADRRHRSGVLRRAQVRVPAQGPSHRAERSGPVASARWSSPPIRARAGSSHGSTPTRGSPASAAPPPRTRRCIRPRASTRSSFSSMDIARSTLAAPLVDVAELVDPAEVPPRIGDDPCAGFDMIGEEEMQHHPRGLVGADLQGALEAQRGDAILAAGEQPARAEPHRQRRSCPIEDRSRRRRGAGPAPKALEPAVTQPPAWPHEGQRRRDRQTITNIDPENDLAN